MAGKAPCDLSSLCYLPFVSTCYDWTGKAPTGSCGWTLGPQMTALFGAVIKPLEVRPGRRKWGMWAECTRGLHHLWFQSSSVSKFRAMRWRRPWTTPSYHHWAAPASLAHHEGLNSETMSQNELLFTQLLPVRYVGHGNEKTNAAFEPQ